MMMASVFNHPTYQHMVNTNKTKSFRQSDLSNQLDHQLLGNSMCISDIMKRMSPEVSKHLLSAKSPMHAINWSLMLDEFLPRHQNSTNRSPRRNKNDQYKPVVLRNKTPYAQLNPGILSPQHYHCGEETNTLRLSKAYTLPHNKDTDVLETLPTGDSSINGTEEDQGVRSPLSNKVLHLLNKICLQSILGDFISSLQHVGSSYRRSGLMQILTSAYYFLYDFMVNILIFLRRTMPANALSRLRTVMSLDPVALINKPLLHEVKLNPPQPNSINLQWPANHESLSRSAIVSFGRYCNFETLNAVSLRC